MRVVGNADISMAQTVRVGPPDVPDVGGWLSSGRPDWLGEMTPEERKRKSRRNVSMLIGASSVDGASVSTRSDLVLDTTQMRLIYQRTPDVRAAVDQITRRVATRDWLVVPNVDPKDPRYEQAIDLATEQTRFLSAPNLDGETWQEVMTAYVTDTLTYDQGAIEEVWQGKRIVELVPVNGAQIWPVVDEKTTRLKGYTQNIFGGSSQSGSSSSGRFFTPNELMVLRLFSNTYTPFGGLPLLESLVNEVVSILRAADLITNEVDASEIPPGLLYMWGIAGDAAKRAEEEFKTKRSKDHKIRLVTSPAKGVSGAEWIELTRTPKEVQLLEVFKQVQRTIWRVFGVMPVEMGASEDIPRAVGQVQLDVSSSHLLDPILNQVAALFNMRVLPGLAPGPDEVGLTVFEFDDAQSLSPDEQAKQAEKHERYIKQGVLTRNEVRDELGKAPIAGGDVPTVEVSNTLMPLLAALGVKPPETSDDDGEDGDDPPPANDGDGGVDDPEAGADEVGEEAPGEVEAGKTSAPQILRPTRASRLAAASLCAKLATYQYHEHGPGCGCNPEEGKALERAKEEEIPSDWQPRGKFDDVRTLNLTKLWDAVSGYHRDVTPLWLESMDEALSAAAAVYTPGAFTEEAAATLNERLAKTLDRLAVRWEMATVLRYRDAAKNGRDAAVDFTGLQVVEDWEGRADQYQARAMSYLQTDLLADVKARMSAAVSAVVGSVERSGPQVIRASGQKAPEGLGVGADEDEFLAAIGASWTANQFRIDNWSGRLVELGSHTYLTGMVEGSTDAAEVVQGQPQPVEWMGSWEAVGDARMCQTCTALNAAGFMPLTMFPTVPGGDTECRARCRCVLVVWTRKEVNDGEAFKVNPVP